MNGLEKRLDKLTGKKVEIEVVQDPQILGGIMIRVGNTMIDGSIAGRLKNLRPDCWNCERHNLIV